MGERPLVFVLILNWKSSEETLQCIQSVQKSDYAPYQILLIDNGSGDGSEEILKRQHPDLPLIQIGRNLGYGGGNNASIRQALRQGAELIWILNPDMQVGPDSLDRLAGVMKSSPLIGICGPRLKVGIPPDISLVDGASFDPERGFISRPRPAEHSLKAPLSLNGNTYLLGCSLLIRREVFLKTGLLREDFFLNSEDIELSIRARRHGWKTALCPEAIDSHHWSIRKKKGFDFYCYERSKILLARIEKKGVLKSALFHLGLRDFISNLIRGRWKQGFSTFFRHLAAVSAGLLKPLRPIPEYKP